MVDRIRKVVENRSNLEPITLFLGAKTAFFGRRTYAAGRRQLAAGSSEIIKELALKQGSQQAIHETFGLEISI